MFEQKNYISFYESKVIFRIILKIYFICIISIIISIIIILIIDVKKKF